MSNIGHQTTKTALNNVCRLCIQRNDDIENMLAVVSLNLILSR